MPLRYISYKRITTPLALASLGTPNLHSSLITEFSVVFGKFRCTLATIVPLCVLYGPQLLWLWVKWGKLPTGKMRNTGVEQHHRVSWTNWALICGWYTSIYQCSSGRESASRNTFGQMHRATWSLDGAERSEAECREDPTDVACITASTSQADRLSAPSGNNYVVF